jgi:hypothetical protein
MAYTISVSQFEEGTGDMIFTIPTGDSASGTERPDARAHRAEGGGREKKDANVGGLRVLKWAHHTRYASQLRGKGMHCPPPNIVPAMGPIRDSVVL